MDKIAQQHPDNFDETLLHEILKTNLVGSMRVTSAFLKKEEKDVPSPIVLVSTDMASTTYMSQAVGVTSSPLRYLVAVSYNASKSAVNSYAVAVAISHPELKVNVVSPGYTATKVNNNYGKNAPGAKSPAQAAERIVQFVLVDNASPTGKFFGFDSD